MRIETLGTVLLVLALAAFGAPDAADAQPASRVHKIGIIAEHAPPDPMLAAFLDGLRDLGYVEGRNIVIETRYGSGALDKYPDLAAELVSLKVDVLVVGGSVAARSARKATTTIPIVFTSVNDPVAAGLVTSLSHPAGNATGLSNVAAELAGKQLEMLRLAAPKISRVAVLHNPLNSEPALKVAREAARTMKLELLPLEVRQAGELPGALLSATSRRADAILALSDPVIGNSLNELSKFAVTNRLPAIYARSEFAQQGGLLAYGPSFSASYRRAAAYVDKLLKGAKPRDLPVEQPTRFELVVNLKTAEALGLALSQSLLQRADRVIE